jgi:hypothetical protein
VYIKDDFASIFTSIVNLPSCIVSVSEVSEDLYTVGMNMDVIWFVLNLEAWLSDFPELLVFIYSFIYSFMIYLPMLSAPQAALCVMWGDL